MYIDEGTNKHIQIKSNQLEQKQSLQIPLLGDVRYALPQNTWEGIKTQ